MRAKGTAESEMDGIRKLVARRLKTQAAGPHPDAELLAAFAENALFPNQREQVLAHVGRCAACRQVLFLALPDAEAAQQVLAVTPRGTRFAFRWGTLAAGVIVVAAVFVGRYEITGRYEPALATIPLASQNKPAGVAEDKASAEIASIRTLPARKAAARAAAAGHPEPKHMTAKPLEKLDFDKSGEVRIVAPAAGAAASAKAVSTDQKDKALSASNWQAQDADSATTNEIALASPAKPAATNMPVAPKTRSDEIRAYAAKASPVGGGSGSSVQGTDQTSGYALESAGARKKQESPATSKLQLTTQSGVVTLPRWAISPEGGVQRSSDGGQTWQPVTTPNGVVFKALSAVRGDIWAGGNSGVLYHSADSGQTWTHVTPESNGMKLSADIVRINFSNSQNGAVETSDGGVWTTSDGGQSWQRK
jgi:Photosynthesis system II assembly factor YCF48